MKKLNSIKMETTSAGNCFTRGMVIPLILVFGGFLSRSYEDQWWEDTVGCMD